MSNKNAYGPNEHVTNGSSKGNGILKTLGEILFEVPTRREACFLLGFQCFLIGDLFFSVWSKGQDFIIWRILGSGVEPLYYVLQVVCFFIAYRHLICEKNDLGGDYMWQTIVSFIIGLITILCIVSALGVLIIIFYMLSGGIPDMWPWGIFMDKDWW